VPRGEIKRKKGDEGMEVPAWVVTYGDMMSLLLCFFVLLLSFSTMSEEAFKEALTSLKGALGVLEAHEALINPVPRAPRGREADENARETMANIARDLMRELQVMEKDSNVRVTFDEEGGLKISLPNEILFRSGSADLMPSAYAVMDELATVLRDVPDAFIEIHGHTDGVPISRPGTFRDNYDLSYARADVVARRLSLAGEIPLTLFQMTASGEGRPIAPNVTPEGRQANRRVEIFVRGAFNRMRIEELRKKAGQLVAPEGDGTAGSS